MEEVAFPFQIMQETFELLDCVNLAPCDEYGYYRIIVLPTKTIKYLRFSCPKDLIPDIRGSRLGFQTVPTGRWNYAELMNDALTQRYTIKSLGFMTMQSMLTWHPISIDFTSLRHPISGLYDGELQCHDKIQSAIYPLPSEIRQPHRLHESQHYHPQPPTQRSAPSHDKDDSVFVHYTWWPSDVHGPARETHIHSVIEARSARNAIVVAPKFLAHLTENNSRVIGYVTEHIKGRAAEPADLAACQLALAKLHSIGIAYGDLKPEGFVVADDSARGVLLHSFGTSFETSDASIFKTEVESLSNVLDSSAKRRRRIGRATRI